MQRIKSIIIAVIMLLSMVSQGVIAATFYDVAGTEYENAVELLNYLGIMRGYDSTTFRPDSTITRAEMAAVALRMLKMDTLTRQVDESKFYDTDFHWAANQINLAAELGILTGFEDGTFRPDDVVTEEQAVKIIVSVLGYGSYAYAKAGYPNGYLQVANSIGLSKGVNIQVGREASRGKVAKLVYNAMSIDIMEAGVTMSDTIVTYEVMEGVTLLSRYFGLTTVKGVVEANSDTSFFGKSTLRDGYILLDNGEMFIVGDTDIDKYLGYYVTLYVEDTGDNDFRTVKFYEVSGKKNNSLVINAENIDSVTVVKGQYQFTYWQDIENDSKPKNVRTSGTPIVIYNGATLINVDVDDLKPKYGKVTLIDNDGDDVYDIIDVLDYRFITVNNVSKSVSRIVGTNNEVISLDEENATVNIYYTDGRKATFDDIRQNNVLAYAASKDNSVKTVIISTASVFGEVTQIDGDKYLINGTFYELNDNVTGGIIGLRSYGEFFLAPNGKISHYKGQSTISGQVGLFAGLSSVDNLSLPQIKIVDTSGQTRVYDLENGLKVNGVKIPDVQTLTSITDASGRLIFGKRSDGKGYQEKVILYKVNANGRIYSIETPRAYDKINTPPIFYVDSESFTSATYRSTSRALMMTDNTTFVDDKIVIFERYTDRNENIFYYAHRMNWLTNDKVLGEFYRYYIDKNDLVYPDVLYLENSASAAEPTRNIWQGLKVYVKTTIVLDENDQETDKYYYYEGTALREGTASRKGILSADTVPGTLMMFEYLSNLITRVYIHDSRYGGNELTIGDFVFSDGTVKQVPIYAAGYHNSNPWNDPSRRDLYYNQAIILDVQGDIIKVATTSGLFNYRVSGNVYKVNFSKNNELRGVERLDGGALQPSQQVLIRLGYGNMREIYILGDECYNMQLINRARALGYSDIVSYAAE